MCIYPEKKTESEYMHFFISYTKGEMKLEIVRIILCGCNGKMGQTVSKLAEEDEQIEIVAGVDPFGGSSLQYPVFPTIEECKIKADVILDFSSTKALETLLNISKERNLPIVLCVTGYSWDEVKFLEAAAKETAILRSANILCRPCSRYCS